MLITTKIVRGCLLLVLVGLFLNTNTCRGKSVQTVQQQISPDCYAPSGKTCRWYRHCLEQRHSCEQSSSPYAIAFAEHFCLRFDKMYGTFSTKGQQWIDATRKCLQVAMVPLLNSTWSPTCKEIRNFAFASHSPCYVSSSSEGHSICRLPFFDWLRVFRTIKSAFIKVAIPTLGGALETVKGCVLQGK